MIVETGSPAGVCSRHPKRETALRCGKCGEFICTRCIVQTPVGARCRDCAQLRRLPQFDVSIWLLARSSAGGLAASAIGWYVVGFIPYLRFFLAIFVGAAVGQVMSVLARQRSNRPLEVAAVVCVIAGLLLTYALRYDGGAGSFLADVGRNQSLMLSLLLPASIASFVAVIKLR